MGVARSIGHWHGDSEPLPSKLIPAAHRIRSGVLPGPVGPLPVGVAAVLGWPPPGLAGAHEWCSAHQAPIESVHVLAAGAVPIRAPVLGDHMGDVTKAATTLPRAVPR